MLKRIWRAIRRIFTGEKTPPSGKPKAPKPRSFSTKHLHVEPLDTRHWQFTVRNRSETTAPYRFVIEGVTREFTPPRVSHRFSSPGRYTIRFLYGEGFENGEDFDVTVPHTPRSS